jgi:phage terminase small subunit
MKLPANLHIVRGPPRKKDSHDSFIHSKSDDDLTSDWIDRPEQWDRTMFVTNASNYLQKKNGGLDTADRHLLSMLASQIEIYVESILKLRSDGLVMAFNGGMTMGPNPYMAIADRALYRSIQVMKELELSPKSRDGYQSTRQLSPELQSLLDGP